ncbi:glycerophosphodiester phosphodiesterase family protein [Jiangella mangrovi]|uniref:Glycerophosphoryl diester phosphodiesterase n=1 Tax=Jiangella mangrovi TaxID=1524084 RepID=A0A7W9GVQ9_9ACTN|nr:glycerophosphodiester phosphodiesterase family protein [Jiangella mangrovi]MBB5790566.1 glycerophosphoryl diester phosphodiesterase [Jiangella mangrovi]
MPNSLLKRTLVVSALVAVGATAAVAPAQATGRFHNPANIAHHGASAAAPENTLVAIDLAYDQGADYAEVEIQRTSDGELVAIQDAGLARTTNVEEVFPGRSPYLVRDFTLAELRQLDAGSWFGAQFAGERIPTLSEVIAEAGYRDGIVIEIRNAALYPGIEEDVRDELAANPYYLVRALLLNKLVVKSASVDSANAFHALAPYVPVGVIYDFRPADADLVAVSEWAHEVDIVTSVADEAHIDRIKELGLKVSVHTVDTETLMTRYIDRDVNGIVTNVPALLAGLLD